MGEQRQSGWHSNLLPSKCEVLKTVHHSYRQYVIRNVGEVLKIIDVHV